MNWRLKVLCVFAAIAVVACVFLSRAWYLERQRYRRAEAATLIAGLTSLQCYRDGKFTDAVQRLEMHIYAIGWQYLASGEGPTAGTTVILEWLRNYRRKYARPVAEWSPTESKLEELIGPERLIVK